MTLDRLLVISSVLAAKYPSAVVRKGQVREDELVVTVDGKIVAYIDIDSGNLTSADGENKS
jgi:outer membrane lipopolysaccharide assembly protein LptE/RlpB